MLKKFYVLSDQAVLICEVKPLSKSKKLHFFGPFPTLAGYLVDMMYQEQMCFMQPPSSSARRSATTKESAAGSTMT